MAHTSTTNAPSERVAPERTINAPSEQVAPKRTTNAPPELVIPQRITSAPAGNGATDEVAIDADGEDSSLSPASPEIVRLPRWDDLGQSYNLNHNLMHKFFPRFSFKATVTKPRSSSSSSSATVPVERCAPEWFVSTRSRLPFHSRGPARLPSGASVMGDRGTMEPAAIGRPDESSYDNWDYQQHETLLAFMNQCMLAAPTEPRHIWKLDGTLKDAPADETPTMALLYMAHVGPLPPIWDLLDCQPTVETLHLLKLEEFTDLINECAPDALVRNSFVILATSISRPRSFTTCSSTPYHHRRCLGGEDTIA